MDFISKEESINPLHRITPAAATKRVNKLESVAESSKQASNSLDFDLQLFADKGKKQTSLSEEIAESLKHTKYCRDLDLFADKGKVKVAISETFHIKAPNLPKGSEWERNVLNSFAKGKSELKTYGEGTTLYRIGDKNGGFWSLTPPSVTEFEWRISTEIKQEWTNNASNLYKLTIPKGSSISGLDGIVGSQGMGLYGGSHQIYIDFKAIPISWIKITSLK